METAGKQTSVFQFPGDRKHLRHPYQFDFAMYTQTADKSLLNINKTLEEVTHQKAISLAYPKWLCTCADCVLQPEVWMDKTLSQSGQLPKGTLAVLYTFFGVLY